MAIELLCLVYMIDIYNADDNGNIIEIFNDNGESVYSKNIPGVKLYIKGKIII